MSSSGKSGKQWLKAELHAHCCLDPDDSRFCRYTPEQLIAGAAGLGYEVLSITCHNLDVWTESLSEYARGLGITLIPGMEVTAEITRHVLVYNFRTGAENLDTLEKIRSRSREDTLVVAPHAFFPGRNCLRGMLTKTRMFLTLSSIRDSRFGDWTSTVAANESPGKQESRSWEAATYTSCGNWAELLPGCIQNRMCNPCWAQSSAVSFGLKCPRCPGTRPRPGGLSPSGERPFRDIPRGQMKSKMEEALEPRRRA